jgi:thymidylate synthase
MAPVVIESPSLGDAWLEVSRRILTDGAEGVYDGLPMKELALVTVAVAEPDPHDALIGELGDPEWSAWMHANFTEHGAVAELGGAASYGVRLHDYAASGRDQVAWVVERLRADPGSRSATITTFQPLTDTAYIPCVSMLDFWRPAEALELVVYAHSLDFGKKAYGNLVELARLQHHVAGELDAPVGSLVVHAKSAHVYADEWELMRRLTSTDAVRVQKQRESSVAT